MLARSPATARGSVSRGSVSREALPRVPSPPRSSRRSLRQPSVLLPDIAAASPAIVLSGADAEPRSVLHARSPPGSRQSRRASTARSPDPQAPLPVSPEPHDRAGARDRSGSVALGTALDVPGAMPTMAGSAALGATSAASLAAQRLHDTALAAAREAVKAIEDEVYPAHVVADLQRSAVAAYDTPEDHQAALKAAKDIVANANAAGLPAPPPVAYAVPFVPSSHGVPPTATSSSGVQSPLTASLGPGAVTTPPAADGKDKDRATSGRPSPNPPAAAPSPAVGPQHSVCLVMRGAPPPRATRTVPLGGIAGGWELGLTGDLPPIPADLGPVTSASRCTHVNLAGARLGPTLALEVLKAMALNRSVRVLDLSLCGLGNAAAVTGFRALARNTATLEHVALAGNGLQDEAAVAFAEGPLRHSAALTVVGLNCNSIGDQGAAALGTALLETNRSVQFLNLRGNDVTDHGIGPIVAAVAREENTALDAVWMRGNPLSTSALDRLHAALKTKCPPPPEPKRRKGRRKSAAPRAGSGAASAVATPGTADSKRRPTVRA